MLLELFRATLIAGLPVAAASYGLVWWSLRQGYIGSVNSLKEMERGFKRRSKERSAAKKDQKRSRKAGEKTKARSLGLTLASVRQQAQQPGPSVLNTFHGKWLAFGGGFYGVVGMLTYGVVELRELRDFFLGFESFYELFANFGINMLVGILVDAVTNFVAAIAWPVYWLSDIRSDHIWIWFIIASTRRKNQY
ncbi:MAG: hypothetical protein OQK01_03840 [Xanthomonadales bacterium]|nr:hypothetical protein [Xanthomonadales bacterium]